MPARHAGRPPGREAGRAGAGNTASPAAATTSTERSDAAGVDGLIAELSVQDKVLLLTGADSWRTQGADALGLRPMITSDGPAGVRGVLLDERHPSSCLPCPSALGATWDTGLVGVLAPAPAAEARSKDADVLLAPPITLIRPPLGRPCFHYLPVPP